LSEFQKISERCQVILENSSMGNLDSGRRGGKRTVEGAASLVLDINHVVRKMEGRTAHLLHLSGIQRGTRFFILLETTLGDDGQGSMFAMHASTPNPDGAFHPEDFEGAQGYTVPLEAAPCHLGGQRWYFLCPLIGWRCTKLYLPSGAAQFMSREAHGLAYRSQRIDPMQAADARLARLYAKLGGSYGNPNTPVPSRPKGMQQQTYALLRSELESELAWFRPRWEAWAAQRCARVDAAFSRHCRSMDRFSRKYGLNYEPE